VNKTVALLCIVAFFAAAEFASANRWLNESIGEWSFIWVENTGARRDVVRGSRKFWRLQDGTYRTTDTLRMKGSDTYISEIWEYPDGTSKTLDYYNGILYGSGEGRWRMRGRKMNWFTTFDSEDGKGFSLNREFIGVEQIRAIGRGALRVIVGE
jgi:hypothetical protein